MPITDAELNKPSNTHLIRPATDSVYRALNSWLHAPNSYEWWWLIIDHANGKYTAIRFEGLRELLARPESGVSMTTRLADLPPQQDNPADWEHPIPGVVSPTIVEQATVGTARAIQLRQDSPGRLLIVLNNGFFRGILSGPERIYAFTDKPLVDMIKEFEQETGSETVIIQPPDTQTPSSEPPKPSPTV